MKRTQLSLTAAATAVLLALICSAKTLRPAAHAAAPPAAASAYAAAPPAAAPGDMASISSLFAGKTYPVSVKAEQIDATFQMVDLVDMQGKAGTYVTRGETATIGGETFLVAYYLPTTPGLTQPKQPLPGGLALLAFINMHYVQAVLNPHPVVPIGTAGRAPAFSAP